MDKDNAPIDPYYQKRAQDVVDLLHDNQLVHPDLKRRDLQALEDYIGFLFQSQTETAVKAALMLREIKERKTNA
jgi:hypothetical protein